jgi:putative transposase
MLPGGEHRQSRYLNHRCEHAHRPTRQRERRLQGWQSAGHAQRFLSASGPIAQHFQPRRHLLSASAYRQERSGPPKEWGGLECHTRASDERLRLHNLTKPHSSTRPRRMPARATGHVVLPHAPAQITLAWSSWKVSDSCYDLRHH